ncbi:MAG: hypothetical protein ACPHV3_00720 [Vibrio sp.]
MELNVENKTQQISLVRPVKLMFMAGLCAFMSAFALPSLAEEVQSQTQAYDLICAKSADKVNLKLKGKAIGIVKISSETANTMQMSLSKNTNIQVQLDAPQFPATIEFTPSTTDEYLPESWRLTSNCELSKIGRE